MPDIVYAQIGLGSAAGGIFALFLVIVLAIVGFLFCILSFVFKKRWLFIIGLVLASPVLALVGKTIIEELPYSKSWDLSSSRSISQIDKKPSTMGNVYYQGNIRSTIKLPSNRQWSGKASLVVFETNSGQIHGISWHGKSASAERIYEETKRILKELGFENHNLDSWYEKVRRGAYAHLRVSTGEGMNPEIRAYLQSFDWEKRTREASWTLMIDVVWKEVGV